MKIDWERGMEVLISLVLVAGIIAGVYKLVEWLTMVR